MTLSAGFFFDFLIAASDKSSEIASAALLAAVSSGSGSSEIVIHADWNRFIAQPATSPAPIPTKRSVATAAALVICMGLCLSASALATRFCERVGYTKFLRHPFQCCALQHSR